jgi:hypothetical protein
MKLGYLATMSYEGRIAHGAWPQHRVAYDPELGHDTIIESLDRFAEEVFPKAQDLPLAFYTRGARGRDQPQRGRPTRNGCGVGPRIGAPGLINRNLVASPALAPERLESSAGNDLP